MAVSAEHVESWLLHAVAAHTGLEPAHISSSLHPSAFGVDSVTAALISEELAAEFEVSVGSWEVLEAPSLAALARRVAGRPGGKPGLVDLGLAVADTQRSILLHEAAGGDASPYWIGNVFVLDGPFDEHALRSAFEDLVDQYTPLRSTYVVNGLSVEQGPVETCEGLDFSCSSLDGLTAPEAEATIRSEAGWHGDLTSGPPLRVRVLSYGELRLLVVNIHHVVVDLRSGWHLLGEVLDRYKRTLEGLPLPGDGRQVRSEGAGVPLGDGLTYWAAALEGARVGTYLPPDEPVPFPATFEAGEVRDALRSTAWSNVKAVARQVDATPNALLLAAVAIVAGMYRDGDDCLIGAAMSYRPPASSASLLGSMTNAVALRVDRTGDPTVRQFVDRTRRAALETMRNSAVSMSRIAAELGDRLPCSPVELTKVFVVHEEGEPPWLRRISVTDMRDLLRTRHRRGSAPGCMVVSLPRGTSQFDLTVRLRESAQGTLAMTFQYRNRLYRRQSIELFARRLRSFLTDLPSRLDTPISAITATTPGSGPAGDRVVLTARGEVCPIGVIGEIHVGEKREPTGTLGRYLHDGRVEEMGSLEDQAPVSGRWVDVAGIRSLIGGSPSVLDVEIVSDTRRCDLTALVVPDPSVRHDPGLRRRLLDLVPPPMRPARMVLLDDIPRLAGGAVDLHQVRAQRPARSHQPVDVSSDEVTTGMLTMVAEVLDVDQADLDPELDFISHGGHSLLAVRLGQLVRERWAVSLSVADILAQRPLRGLVDLVDERTASAACNGERWEILKALEELEEERETRESFNG